MLNFNARSSNLPIRRRPSRLAESSIRPNILTSPGITADRPFPPYKYLPVMFQDVSTQDWTVLLKGSIVSLLTNQSADPKFATATDLSLLEIDNSGEIYIGLNAGGTMTSVNVDSSYWGYEDSMAGLLVPANGGSAIGYPYTTDDVTAQTITVSGAYVTVANVAVGVTLPIAANKPVGVLYQDVYADIDGKWLNYELQNKAQWGMIYDHVIEVPYVDNYKLYNTANIEGNIITAKYAIDTTLGAGANMYDALRRKHAFLWASYSSQRALAPGSLLKADLYGKYTLFTDESSGESQVVGKLICTDSRFPKSKLEYVDTYYGSGMAGTETGGLPSYLFTFVYDLLVASGITPTIKQCVDVVWAGAVGIAYINVQVA